jgi:DNA-binding PadR family transcriptional regulator
MASGNVGDVSFGARSSYLRSCALLLLTEGPKHGYELLVQLSERGYGDADPGGLYRALRSMEEEGLVCSSWEYGDFGPARRVYAVTEQGVVELRDSVATMRDMRRRLSRFLRHYRNLANESLATESAARAS